MSGKKRHSYCRPCRKQYDSENWRARRGSHVQAVYRWQRARRAWLNEFKNTPCVDCGGRFHPEAMQFDHLRDKIDNISHLIKTASMEKVRAEIAKTDLVCANCHAVRTANRRLSSTKASAVAS